MHPITEIQTALLVTALAFASAVRAEDKDEQSNTASSSVRAVVSSGPQEKQGLSSIGTSGSATITIIDADGHKTTKTIDLAPGSNGGVQINGVSTAKKEMKPSTRLGVAVETVSGELGAALPVNQGVGLVVKHVEPNSAAAKAGIEENDVLTELDDQILVHPKQLQTLITNKNAGDKVGLVFFRKLEKKAVKATLESGQPDHTADPFPIQLQGIDLGSLLKPGVDGVTVHVMVGPDGKHTVIEGLDALPKTLQDLKALREKSGTTRGQAGKTQLADISESLEAQTKKIEEMQKELKMLSEQIQKNAGKEENK